MATTSASPTKKRKVAKASADPTDSQPATRRSDDDDEKIDDVGKFQSWVAYEEDSASYKTRILSTSCNVVPTTAVPSWMKHGTSLHNSKRCPVDKLKLHPAIIKTLSEMGITEYVPKPFAVLTGGFCDGAMCCVGR